MEFARLPYSEFLDRVAAKTPTPGGGSAAALAAAAGAALASMALKFSYDRKDVDPGVAAVLSTVDAALLEARQSLLQLADDDSAAYDRVRAARKLAKGTEAEKLLRETEIQSAVVHAAETPLRTARVCRDALECLEGALESVHRNLATDAASGALLLTAGARSALLNVEVNLLDLKDPRRVESLRAQSRKLEERVLALEKVVQTWVRLPWGSG
jgi:methenyltetrahydrofolate cyclohydrolase